MNRARNTDDAARRCERFVYSTVKITRLHDYQTWQTHFSRNSRGAQRFVGFFLDCVFRMLIGWAGELGPHGMEDTKIQLRNAEFWFRLYVSLFTSMQPS